MQPHPTPYPDLNGVLRELVARARQLLGARLVGAYLQGSFAVGDFDKYSDVDWLVVIDEDLPDELVPALQAMHGALHDTEVRWAKHLEGSYAPRAALGRGPLPDERFWYLDNGSRELVRSDHDNSLVVRWVTRERGIALAGPAPQTIVAPVAADDLRREVLATMHEWGAQILADTERWMTNRWGQPFVVLSYCRMLHTLHTGTIESKPAGARWAMQALDQRWAGLIERAWGERQDQYAKVHLPADPDEVARTRAFVAYALEQSKEHRGRP